MNLFERTLIKQLQLSKRSKQIFKLSQPVNYYFEFKGKENDKMDQLILYLHIGAPKTGSSSIQEFMVRNSSNFISSKLALYPNATGNNVAAEIDIHKNPTYYWHGRLFASNDKNKVVSFLQQCVNFCYEKNLNRLVISNETALNKATAGFIAEAVEAVGVSTRVICYIRRQDHYLESAWKQWGVKEINASDIQNSQSFWSHCNWLDMVNNWSQFFGKENMIIRPYENLQLKDGLIIDFLTCLELKANDLKKLEVDDIITNPGFTRDILEILSLNRVFYSGVNDHRLNQMFESVLDERYLKKPFDNYHILSPKQRLQILEKHEPSNQQLAREYLGREEGRLFYEDWPDKSDEVPHYEGLTLERFVPIVTQILFVLYQNQKHLRQKITHLENNDHFQNKNQNLNDVPTPSIGLNFKDIWTRLKTFVQKYK